MLTASVTETSLTVSQALESEVQTLAVLFSKCAALDQVLPVSQIFGYKMEMSNSVYLMGCLDH